MTARSRTSLFFLSAIFILTAVGLNSHAQTEWAKYPDNVNPQPVLVPGPASWEINNVNTPFVLKDGGIYKMWYAGDGGAWRIGYATSTDGINWTKYAGNPVLDLGNSGDWDEMGVLNPVVLLDNGIYKMWYASDGNFSSGNYARIGYATSTDGINWTKYAQNPVLSGDSLWDDGNVFPGSVLIEDGIYKMWYCVGKGPTLNGVVGYAVSSDGVNWNKPINQPVLDTGSPGTSCSVLHEEETYQMWYRAANVIEYATSIDGIDWVKSVENPVLSPGSPGTFDDRIVEEPSVIRDEASYKLWYGAGGNQARIGLAMSGVVPANHDPTLTVTSTTITVDEGRVALNSGSVDDTDGDSVTLSASVGKVIDNGNGTWSWSFPTTNGPDESQDESHPVTISAYDDKGGTAEPAKFTLTVNNVAPTVELGDDATINIGETFISNGSFSDPGDDTWTARVDYGDGSQKPLLLNPNHTFSLNHTYVSSGTHTVTVTVSDDDGGSGYAELIVTVMQPPGPPQEFNLVLTVRDDSGNIVDASSIDPEMPEALEKAEHFWESLFADPVTVNIDIMFSNHLKDGEAGNTEAIPIPAVYYRSTRSHLTNDVDPSSAFDSEAVQSLPVEDSLEFFINRQDNVIVYDNNDSSNKNVLLNLTSANAKALKFDNSPPIVDATITLNNNRVQGGQFDYNPNDGIDSEKWDFVGTVIHEVGHALGFTSGVDLVDEFIGGEKSSLDNEVVFYVLDLFRYSAPNKLDFSVGDATWPPYFSIDGGVTKLALFSTGKDHGDGWSPGHWKDSFFLPNNKPLGLMDPKLDLGEHSVITLLDLIAFDVIGWDLKEGVIPSMPVLPEDPSLVDGKWLIECSISTAGLGINSPIWIDPDSAVGYDYEVTNGSNFASVTMPTGIGDDLFDLYLFDSTSNAFVFHTTLSGGNSFDFTSINPLGVSKFRIVGIEKSAELDPNDPFAFPTGVTFVSSGDINITMKPLTPTGVLIDIKPSSDPNSINLDSNGVISVAILTTDEFDTTNVDQSSLTLEGAAARTKGKSGNVGSFEDVDGDGDQDLVVQFPTAELNLTEADTSATVEGLALDGTPIQGSDSIVVVPPAAPMAHTVPKETRALLPFPAPANPETWIPYQLAEPTHVSITIYDTTGLLLRTLDLGHQAAGFYDSKAKAAYWDGRNSVGEQVSSGIYFYYLQTSNYHATRKILILK